MPARMLFIMNLSFAIAAGIGFDLLYKKFGEKKTSKNLIISLSIVGGIALLSGLGAFSNMLNTPQELKSLVDEQGLLAFGIMVLIGFFAVFASKVKTNANIIGALLALIVFFDLYMAGEDFNKIDTNPNTFYSSMFNQMPELRDTLTPKYPNDIFRVNMRLYSPTGQTLAKPMEDAQGMLDYIMLIEGYNPLILNRMNPPIRNQEIVKDMKNIKYALGIDSSAGNLAFLRRDSRFGNAWLVYDYKYIPTKDLEDASKNNKFEITDNIDFRNTAVLEKQLSKAYSKENADSVQHSIKVKEYTFNNMTYSVTTNEPAIMVFSEIYYPDWKIYINGIETEMMPANFSFRACEVPAGTHTIEMKYESAEFKAGAAVSITTFIISILALIGFYFYEKKRHKEIN